MLEENKVILKINGTNYEGWTSVSITTALESFFRTFIVESSRRVGNDAVPDFGGAIGDTVEVFIGQDKVITGYVTKVDLSYSARSIDVRVEGAGRPWVMHKSSLPRRAPKTYQGMSLFEAISRICGFFDIAVCKHIDFQDIGDISFAADEEIFVKLKSLLKKKTLLLSEDESGNLVLTQSGYGGVAHDSISYGRNVLEGARITDAEKLYGEYLVYGQGTNPQSIRPVTDNQLVGWAKGLFPLPRVLTKKQTGNAVQTDLDVRAHLLKEYSEATATALTYKVQGWRQSNSELWRVNQKVYVDDGFFGMKSSFLISSITYSLATTGMVSTVQLVPVEAFSYVDLSSAEDKAKATTTATGGGLKSIDSVAGGDWTRQ